MPSLNVLVVGNGSCIKDIRNSKYLNKLFITSDIKFGNAINLRFNTFRDLAQKCKSLQIDLVVIEEEKYILQGIADVLKLNYINCIAPTSKWTNLKLDSEFRTELLSKYKIKTPPKIILPIDFPIMVKADGFTKKADNIQEIIQIKQNLYDSGTELAKTVFLERYIDGKNAIITSLFDGKHLLSFPVNDLNSVLVDDYSQKLEKMLVAENANFTGFINSHVIQDKQDIYNIKFSFEFIKPNCKYDLLFLLNSAIYQNLNEMTFD